MVQNRLRPQVARTPSSASLGLTGYSQVDILGLR